MIWGGIDIVWHIIHIVLIIVIGLNPLLWWFYWDIAWYSIMIIMDILVIVGANGDVRIKQKYQKVDCLKERSCVSSTAEMAACLGG